ncbi:hypothetical protein [Brevundimonas sp.]|uniref:hypothetical protein n=1 Tax=Brevundimonas sp. TaxID=1871086 RepID=UPI003517EC98
MKHPVSAAATATFISGWAFALAFGPLASIGLAVVHPRGGLPSIMSDALGMMVIFIFVTPVVFFIFFVGALIPAAGLFYAFRHAGLANPVTAALVGMMASAAAPWPLLSPMPEFIVASGLAGSIAGAIYYREMGRWLTPRPARPS